jgi:hypothetical protein
VEWRHASLYILEKRKGTNAKWLPSHSYATSCCCLSAHVFFIGDHCRSIFESEFLRRCSPVVCTRICYHAPELGCFDISYLLSLGAGCTRVTSRIPFTRHRERLARNLRVRAVNFRVLFFLLDNITDYGLVLRGLCQVRDVYHKYLRIQSQLYLGLVSD